jgi:Cu/Ag efflux pump CusA
MLGLLAGLLMVFGIAVRNTMMTVSTCQHLEEQEGEDFGLPLVLRGARERLVPILMTALTVGLALLPFLLFGNIPGHEVVRPVAIAILGGLFTSTFYTLFIVPALYLRFGASREADLGIVPVPASTEA